MKSSKRFSAILLVLVASLFMVNFASALELNPIEKVGYNWDNVEQFTRDGSTSDYGKYEIRNSVLGLSWFQYGKVADIELKNNSNYCTNDCFAEKEITLYEDGVLVDDIIFKTLQGDGSWVSQDIRSYSFTYNNGERDISYTKGDIVRAGTYTLRLEGSKKPTRTVDWIIKTNGIWTNEWAVWGTRFEIYDEINDSSINSTLWLTSTNGLSGSAVTEDTDVINVFAYETGSAGKGISELESINIVEADIDSLNISIKLEIARRGDTVGIANTTLTVFGQTIKSLYGSGSFSTPETDDSIWLISRNETNTSTFDYYNDGVYIGTFTPTNNYIKIYTSADEQGGGGSRWVRAEGNLSYVYYNERNAIQLISPNNNSVVGSQQVEFNTTIQTGSGATLVNATLYTNETGSFEARNITTGLSGVINNLTWARTFSGQPNILWNVEACDSDGDCAFSIENSTFSVDTLGPSISIENPSGALDYSFIGGNEILNVTFTDSNLDSCWYDYNGTNITIDGCLNGVKNSTEFTLETGNTNMTLYANDTVGNLNSTFIDWNYTYFENNRTHNNESFETDSETFSINVEGPTSVSLFYNGTEYTTTKSGDDFTRTIQIPAGQLGNNTVYWRFDDTSNSINSYQNISETVFALCDATYTTAFLNISFKDEEDLSVINASIPTSTFEYWLGDGTVTKTLSFINNTDNLNYEFCATPNRTFNFNSLIQYKQGSAYPQRVFSQDGGSLTNETTNLTLYLLGVSDGLFVTFQIFGQQSQTLQGVSVTGTRVLDGADQVVAQGTSDAAGTVTFWLNPDFLHTLTYVKTGFETVIESIFPTQTLYTVNMGGAATLLSADNSEGVIQRILPKGSFLDTNTFYTFSYIINSSVLTLDEYGFELFYNNGTSIHSATDSTATGGTLDKSFNTSNETRLSMDYYYIINGTRINGATSWLIYEANDFSIYHFFTRVTTYIGLDMFGIQGDDEGYFAKALLSITLLILVTGSLSMRYGLASEAAVTGLLFGVIFMLNIFDLIPTPSFLGFIQLGDFLVFLVALYAITTIIKEEGR